MRDMERTWMKKSERIWDMLYDFLGLPQTKEGEELGWSLCDGYCWIDFEHTLLSKDDGGMPVYSIDAVFSPHDEYDDY